MTIKFIIQILVGLIGLVTVAYAQSPLQHGPFFGVDLAMLPAVSRVVIEQASEDFERVLVGRRPVHARFDAEAALPADGGTTFYTGSGYRLTIVKSIAHLNGGGAQADISGYLYGPTVTLDEDILAGNNRQVISAVRFYTVEQLRQLQQIEQVK